ncbi:hypothetical protein ASC64_17075 [Nocardioides sp. Root122]|uniref:hypothetical protein n=1 Tax=Nocardioides TaxID=1839 RepID=UPI00070288AF|nr:MULTISPECIES: hypothetical protein [Nocardioides]KQV63315.1 hypothetical protein ASC64_17075 [Nocardioides sp. Root122]MCK9825952.1 hypothetical protein [Nocardioides cavernae]
MADTPDDGPSLEMPSFSLRRRKREPEDTAPEPEPAVPEPEPVAPEPVVPQPEPTPVVPEPTQVIPEPQLHDEPEAEDVGRRRARIAPPVTGLPAALLVGLLVGLLAVAYAWLTGVGCEAVRGTSACGGAAGLPLLLAGLVLLAWVGALLLRFFGVADPGSTSILAVGVLSVLVMLFLLDALDQWWALVAVPVLAVAGYALSWWVTASVVGDDAGAAVPEPHDVR